MSTSHLSITLENETINKLDSVRGLAKRSTVIQSIVSEFLDKKDAVVKKDQSNTTQPPRRKVS